ncbi:MAG TPA: efflux RND transporter permease subunit [Nocardioidaceae bacterium]|nr:efflux RND transporter permease subunit [Nocardioidaceae bacterium]
MIGWIVGAGVRARALVLILAVAAVVMGVVLLRATPIEPVPEFAPVTVEVQSEALGLSAQEVEDLVTVPLESNLLSGVAWVDRMQSSSIPGLSSIVMTFEEGTDPVRARQVVQERLTQGALLTNASKAPVMLQPTSAANRVMMIGMSSQSLDLVDLSVLSRWTIRPKLMSVAGVANVAVWGMRDRQLHVQADPVRMQQHGVSLDELVATTGNSLWVSPLSFLEASTPGRGGFLDLPQQRVNVQHISPITDTAALGRVAVENAPRGVTLADVATIVEAPPTIIGDGIVDEESGLVLVVEKQPGTSTAEVSRGIEQALASLSVGLPGVELDSSLYRPADYVGDAERNLALAALGALLLLAVVCALVYRAWRPVVMVVCTVTFSVLAGYLLLWLREPPVTLIAVTGLAAGAVLAIAQAVAAVDTVSRTPHELPLVQRVSRAYGMLGVRAVYTAVAVALLVVPAYLLEGRWGAFLPEAATGFLLATAGALLVALLVAPGVAALIGTGSSPAAALPDSASRRLSSAAGRLASSAMAIVAVLAFGIAACAALAVSLGVEPRPEFQERTVVLKLTAPEGTSPQSLARSLGTLAGEVHGLEGVVGVGGHVGRAVTGERVVGANSGELWISIDPDADRAAVMSGAMEAARSAGGMRPSIGGYLDGRLDTIHPDPEGSLVVSVYGPIPDTLRTAAQDTLEVVSETPGVTGARLVEPPTEQNIEITVDLEKTQELGMTPGDVRRQAATLVGGLEVGAIFEQQKVFDVQVWSREDLRNSPEKIQALPINVRGGGQMPLSELGTVKLTEQPTIIERESVQRRLDIVAYIDSGATRDDVAESLSRMQMPAEYHAEVRGEAATAAANVQEVLLFAAAALLGVLHVLQAATRNWWTAVAATAAIPLAMSGGFLAALLVGELTIGCLLGLVALAVLGVHNALTVVGIGRESTNDQRDDAALRAVMVAVLPATVLTFLVGVGVALVGARPGLEALGHLGLVTAGGAITSGIVSLLVLPAVTARYGGREEALEDLTPDDMARFGPAQVGAHA